MATSPPVVFDSKRIYDIKERSDIDHHQNQKAITDQLEREGEDWGDGFIVQDEMVVVTRSKATGAILRTTPMSEALFMERDEQEYEPIEVAPRPSAGPPLSISEREKMVGILAMRLFKWYQVQPRQVGLYNPVYDGIPHAPAGSAQNLQPLPGTNLYPATGTQVMEWLKVHVIGPRAQIINKRQGRMGVASDYALRIVRNPD